MFTIGTKKNKDNKIVKVNIVKPYDTEYVKLSSGKIIKDSIVIPCGKCIGCRLEYSRQWANRCLLELQYHASSLFITLTYDDEHLPEHEYFIEETGEVGVAHSLVKKDLQDFIKRLRKYLSDRDLPKIRYFACGEYGDTSCRPHYHVIVFGLSLPDLKYYARNDKGFPMYNSDIIDKEWNKGFAVIEDVSWETCAYTARYVMKKMTGEAGQWYSDRGIVPPFLLMSRNPGIGRQYFDDHKESLLYGDGYINVATETGGKHFNIPRYFRNLLDEELTEFYNDIKIVRRDKMEEVTDSIIKTTKDFNSYAGVLRSQEVNQEGKLHALHRSL